MTSVDFLLTLASLGPLGLAAGVLIGYRFPHIAPRLLGRKHTP
jgi:hypothetical protein